MHICPAPHLQTAAPANQRAQEAGQTEMMSQGLNQKYTMIPSIRHSQYQM